MKLNFDSSAIVNLIQVEPETNALRQYLRRHRSDQFVTSALSRVEVVRAVLQSGSRAIDTTRRQRNFLNQIGLGVSLLDQATALMVTTQLRSLDAIHLAAAQMIGPDLRAVITYDERMSEAAGDLGLLVVAPSTKI